MDMHLSKRLYERKCGWIELLRIRYTKRIIRVFWRNRI